MGGPLHEGELSMQPAASDVARARAAIYFALAAAVAEPAPDSCDTLFGAAMAGAQILDSESSRAAALALAALPSEDRRTLAERYTCAVAPPGRRPLALYESLAREGCLMGESTLAVERSYRALGLEPNFGELPDHASVELCFLGNLAEAEADAQAERALYLVARLRKEQRRFFHDHVLAWLPALGRDLAASGIAPYAAVGTWLAAFVQEESAGKRNGRRRGKLPALLAATACTLCGLCTGRCGTGALRIEEDATETRLTLYAARCVGCNLCTAICPQNVMTMIDGQPDRHTIADPAENVRPALGQLLRSSPRLSCPRCGRPTVSRAEMDAVCARVQLDEHVLQRMRLCVTCKSMTTNHSSQERL
jgi:TorA maturation chaperone TorD/NAD-dependent dihydropyrimidine dehydrogenase PreA subunit